MMDYVASIIPGIGNEMERLAQGEAEVEEKDVQDKEVWEASTQLWKLFTPPNRRRVTVHHHECKEQEWPRRLAEHMGNQRTHHGAHNRYAVPRNNWARIEPCKIASRIKDKAEGTGDENQNAQRCKWKINRR